MDSSASYSIVIADDHPLFRGALREAVSGLLKRVEVDEAGSFEEVTHLLESGGEVDLILLDLAMPGVRGFSGLMYLRAQYPSAPIVVVSANDDRERVHECLQAGARGYITKTSALAGLPAAMKAVLEGGRYVPPQFR